MLKILEIFSKITTKHTLSLIIPSLDYEPKANGHNIMRWARSRLSWEEPKFEIQLSNLTCIFVEYL